MKQGHDKDFSREEALSAFDREIARQEDIVYGLALFFECLSVIHANQPTAVETHRKQFRNFIQKGRERIAEALQLRDKVRRREAGADVLADFAFAPCQGHAQPESMAKRAEALAATYKKLFEYRPRSKEFTPEETLLLIENASELLDP